MRWANFDLQRLFGIAFCVVICATASCGSGDAATDADSPSVRQAKAGIAGRPDAELRAAVKELTGVLNDKDWGYLMSAVWPEDVSLALADPTLFKALDYYGPQLPQRGAGSNATATGPAGSYNQGVMQANWSKARTAMIQSNGAAKAGHPAGVAAIVALTVKNSFRSAGGTPLPPPGQPVDPAADYCGVYFYDGKTLSPNCPPFCCKAVVDYNAGTFTCHDSTSCRGSGTIPKATASGGTNPPGGSNACDAAITKMTNAGEVYRMSFNASSGGNCYGATLCSTASGNWWHGTVDQFTQKADPGSVTLDSSSCTLGGSYSFTSNAQTYSCTFSVQIDPSTGNATCTPSNCGVCSSGAATSCTATVVAAQCGP